MTAPRAAWLAFGALCAAIGGGLLVDRGAVALLIVTGCVGTMAVVAAARRSVRGSLLLAGAIIVLLRVAVGAALSAPAAPRPLPAGEHDWFASIVRVGSTDGGMQRAMLSARLAEAVVGAPDDVWPVYGWLPRYPIVAGGDTIEFQGAIEPVPPESGFGDVLRSLGAAGSTRPRAFDLVPRPDGAAAAIAALRSGADDRLFAALPQREAGLAAGILVGARELVDRSVADAFTTSGLSHVVAISGWNIGVVAAAIAALLSWLPRRPRSLVMLLAIVAYTVATGASASVVRAATMGGVAVLARESGRRGTAASALALAVLLLLIADPAMVTDVGFQLSTIATCGLLAWATPLQRWLDRRLPARTPKWLVETLGVSLAAQAATLPLILLEFGRLSLVSPLANMLAAPLIVPVMLAASAALVLGAALAWIPPLILAPALVCAWLPIAALIAVADACASLPFASVTLPPPFDMAGAALSAIAVLGVAWLRRRRRAAATSRPAIHRAAADRRAPSDRRPAGAAPADGHTATRSRQRLLRGAALLATCLVLGTATIVAARPSGRFSVTALDVGQGDSLLLQGDQGARVLIDGGPDPNVLLTRLDERIPAWDRRLDLLILSHPHEDHAAGLPLLLDRFDVRAVADTGMLGNGPGDHAFRSALAERNAQLVRLAEGDHLSIDHASATVLWPRPGTVPLHPANDGAAVNDVSIVLDIRFGARRFLLTGDVQEEIDPELLSERISGPGQPRVDLLKVAHHGSATASSQPFLDAIQPRVAFVSAGLGNPYGHPAPSTIARLQGVGADVYRTDTDGTLEASSDGTDLAVTASGPHARAQLPAVRLASTRSASSYPGPAFSCAIGPLPGGAGVRTTPQTGFASFGVPAQRRVATHGWQPPPDVHLRQDLQVRAPRSGRDRQVPQLPCYDRPDERPLSRASRRGAARPPARGRPVPSHDGRCRDRRGSRCAPRGEGRPDRSADRRDGSVAP